MNELPLYQSHKRVRAAKIADLKRRSDVPIGQPGAWVIGFTDPGIKPYEADGPWVGKHQPQVGGYVVIYDDGYTSYSPAGPFEAGYTKVLPDAERTIPAREAITRIEPYDIQAILQPSLLGQIAMDQIDERAHMRRVEAARKSFEAEVAPDNKRVPLPIQLLGEEPGAA